MKALLKVFGFLLGSVCLIYGAVGTVVGLGNDPGMGILLIFTVPMIVVGVFLIRFAVRKSPAAPPPQKSL